MTTTDATTTPAWSGWYRLSKLMPWTRLVAGASYDTCWAELVARTARWAKGEVIVTRATADPNVAPVRLPGQRGFYCG
jgi:hypothetical protein